MNTIVIFVAGGHAKVVMESLLAQNHRLIELFDDHPAKLSSIWLGFPVLGGRAELLKHYQEAPEHYQGLIITIGDNEVRHQIYAEFAQNKVPFTSAIHPQATIAASTVLGHGLMIMANAVINPDTRIGDNVIVNTAAVIEHDCVIGDHSHIAPRATICGGVSVGELSLVGAGAIVLPQVKIGKRCIIGAGAVVLGDVPDDTTVIGNPAKSKKDKNAQ